MLRTFTTLHWPTFKQIGEVSYLWDRNAYTLKNTIIPLIPDEKFIEFENLEKELNKICRMSVERNPGPPNRYFSKYLRSAHIHAHTNANIIRSYNNLVLDKEFLNDCMNRYDRTSMACFIGSKIFRKVENYVD